MGLLNWEGLPEEGERGGRGSHGEIRRGCILGERNSQWKGSEVGTHLAFEEQKRDPFMGRRVGQAQRGWGGGAARYAPVSIQPSVRD